MEWIEIIPNLMDASHPSTAGPGTSTTQNRLVLHGGPL